MISQQYLLVVLALIILVMNVLGLAFTIRRNRQHRLREEMHSHRMREYV
jgi:sensor domain CHASE-containing protein